MATADYAAIYKTIRDQLLGYSDGASDTVAFYLGVGNAGRIYQESAPAGAVYPYAVMRIFNDRTSDNGYSERTEMALEIMVWDRPRSNLPRARRLADLFDKALKRFTSAGSAVGVLRVTGRTRDAVPQGTGDADSEIVQIRFLFGLFAWPQYLTSA